MAYCELPDKLRGRTFATWETRVDIEPDAMAKLTHIEMEIRAFAHGEASFLWLVLAGSVGWGKTHLAAAICNWRLDHPDQRAIAKFVTCPDLLGQLRASYDDNSYSATLELYRRVPLLILDDVGSEYRRKPTNGERGPSWSEEQLYLILSYRYVHEFETVITSNAPADSLDVRLKDRFLDTGTGLCRVFNEQLPSYRTGRLEV